MKITRVETAGQTDLGVAEFSLAGPRPLDREDLIARMVAKHVFLYSIERTDLTVPASLRALRASAVKDPRNQDLSDHTAVARALSALGLLRAWTAIVGSANSDFAVTPRLDGLTSTIHAHIRLLEKRGFTIEAKTTQQPREAFDRSVQEILDHKTQRIQKLWKFSARDLAEAARNIELTAFHYLVTELHKASEGAEAIAARVSDENPLAASQHRLTARYAMQMSRMLTNAVRGISIPKR